MSRTGRSSTGLEVLHSSHQCRCELDRRFRIPQLSQTKTSFLTLNVCTSRSVLCQVLFSAKSKSRDVLRRGRGRKLSRRSRWRLFLISLALLTGCNDDLPVSVLAEVRKSYGDAFLVRQIGKDVSRTALQEGMTIGPGQAVETSPGAMAVISLLPGITVQLNPDSSFGIDALAVIKSGHLVDYPMKSRQAKITLRRGSIYANTPPLITHVVLGISTPAGLLTAPTLSTVYVGSDGVSVEAAVAQGQLTVRSKTGATATILPKGQFLVLAAGGTARSPQPASANESVSERLRAANEFGQRADLTSVELNSGLPGASFTPRNKN